MEESLKILDQAHTTKISQNLAKWQQEISQDIKQDYLHLEELKVKDINWRLKNRQDFKKFLFLLLVFQNLAVFFTFALGLWFNKIAGLEQVFGVLVGGTLAETTSLIYIIVKWLFSEIPYSQSVMGNLN